MREDELKWGKYAVVYILDKPREFFSVHVNNHRLINAFNIPSNLFDSNAVLNLHLLAGSPAQSGMPAKIRHASLNLSEQITVL